MNQPEINPDWECYLFGARGPNDGITYRPVKGMVPNVFVRWMMRICFGCRWVRRPK